MRLCEAAKEKSGEHAGKINPVLALSYLVLANTIMVEVDIPLSPDPCAGSAFAYLQGLVPAYASLMAVRRIGVSDEFQLYGADPVENDSESHIITNDMAGTSAMGMPGDSVVFTLVPDSSTEEEI